MTPTEAGKRFTEDLYDEEILGIDSAIARLAAGLEAQGKTDDTLVVVTSDHGEEFWEHDNFEHGHALYAELTRVPLVVAGPGIAQAEVSTVVEHVDLFQGLLGVAGAARPEGSEGDDIFAIAKHRPHARDRNTLSENCLYGPDCISLADYSTRLLLSPQEGRAEVWAIGPLGFERQQLDGERGRLEGQRLVNALDAKRGTREPLVGVAGPRVPSFEVFEQLATLGYVDDAVAPAAGESSDPCM